MRDFLGRCHLLSVSVAEVLNCQNVARQIPREENLECGVYCASCYYVFCQETLSLCFKSSEDSKHIELARISPCVGVAIARDSENLSSLEGMQIQAFFKDSTPEERRAYYKRFPFARLGGGSVFSLEILWAKYTNNTLLLKEKLIYKKE